MYLSLSFSQAENSIPPLGWQLGQDKHSRIRQMDWLKVR